MFVYCSYLYVKRWQRSRLIHLVLCALPAQSKTIVECNFFSFYRKSLFAPSPKIENEYIDFHINKYKAKGKLVIFCDKLQWTQFVRLFAFWWSWCCVFIFVDLAVFADIDTSFIFTMLLVRFWFVFVRLRTKKFIWSLATVELLGLFVNPIFSSFLLVFSSFFFLHRWFPIFFSPFSSKTTICLVHFSSIAFHWFVVWRMHNKIRSTSNIDLVLLQRKRKQIHLQIRLLLFARYALSHKTIDMEDIWKLLRSIFINLHGARCVFFLLFSARLHSPSSI